MKYRKDFSLVWIVAQRELVDQMRDWRVIMPMIILVIFFPYLMNFAARQAVDFINQYGANTVAERIIPFLVLVVGFFPVTVSLVVALESFVGEKERGTIEPMLSSPLEDWHMYFGKLIAGTLVPLGAGYLSTALYLGGLVYQKIALPEAEMIIQTLALSTVQTVLMVSAAMVISTQSTSVRAANLLASFIVIPVALLIQGESVLLFWGNNQVLWFAVVGVAIMAGLLVRLGLSHFQRERLIGREIDVLDLRYMLRQFWKAYSGTDQPTATWAWASRKLAQLFRRAPVMTEDATFSLGAAFVRDILSVADWYKHQVGPAFGRLRLPLGVVSLIGLIAIVGAYVYTSQTVTLSENFPISRLFGLLDEQLDGDVLHTNLNVPFLFFNNFRAVVLIMFFGMFSFGVIGILVYILNFSLIGAILGGVELLGIPPWTIFVYGILPHGVFELAAVIFATAAMLNLGVRLVTPEENVSIGEVFIEALAEWVRLMVAVCIPLLLLAAVIEVYVTPGLLIGAVSDVIATMPR